MKKSKVIRLAGLPDGMPKTTDFSLGVEAVQSLGEGQLLLKPLYISVDPYLRAKMSGGHQPPLYVGDVIYSRAIAEVIESRNHTFNPGDIVLGFMEWRDLLVHDGKTLIQIERKGLPLSTYLGVLGSTGLSAYFALKEIGRPKPTETVVVSGAAGAVGSIAGQIAKIMGCKVIGIVGSELKADFITSTLGFDAAINYNDPGMADALRSLCPDGIDVYFDNVGGSISDTVISQMNDYGRVVVCGSIANYNDVGPEVGPRLLPIVVFKKLMIQGFLISDYKERYGEGIAQLQEWLVDGSLHYAETVIQGFEQLPEAFIGLFSGRNEGKMIVEIG
jgi:NADPH-dependent curcumin reductase CurA